MQQVLVVYSSKTGCAEEVAQRIAEVLRDEGNRVDVRSAQRAPRATGYDAVVVGSGVRRMRWYKPVTKWAEDNSWALAEMPVAFFSVGLTPVKHPELASRIAAFAFSVLVKTGVRPVTAGNFKGCFDPSKLSKGEIAMVRAMGVAEGDYREWDVIEGWARKTAARIEEAYVSPGPRGAP